MGAHHPIPAKHRRWVIERDGKETELFLHWR
jgi:hypothetical protein